MKRLAGRNCGDTAIQTDDFIRAKYEHMMRSTDRLPRFYKLRRLKATQDLLESSSCGFKRAASDTRDKRQKMSPRRWPVFWLPGFEEDYRLPLGTDNVLARPLLVYQRFEGEKQRMRFEGF